MAGEESGKVREEASQVWIYRVHRSGGGQAAAVPGLRHGRPGQGRR